MTGGNNKSRLLGLMAKREAAKLAGARRGFAAVVQEQKTAQTMTDRLAGLQHVLREQGLAVQSVAALRGQRHVAHQIAVEAERQRTRAEALQDELARAAAQLARQDHRQRVLQDAAKTALQCERTEREARAEAARPNPPRPAP